MIQYQVEHLTEYEYTNFVNISHNEARLKPTGLNGQTCLENNITVEPAPEVTHVYQDFFGNQVFSFTIQQPHQKLSVKSISTVIVERKSIATLDRNLDLPWSKIKSNLWNKRNPDTLVPFQFLFDSPYCSGFQKLHEFAEHLFQPDTPLLQLTEKLTGFIYEAFDYVPDSTDIQTSLAKVLEQKKGVCQDFAHLQIAILRMFGLPARYVSGYLATQPPEGQERLRGVDASHAWLAIWHPVFGWLETDPTNNQWADDNYVTIGWGRDFGDVSPIKGVTQGGGKQTLKVAVDVDPIKKT